MELGAGRAGALTPYIAVLLSAVLFAANADTMPTLTPCAERHKKVRGAVCCHYLTPRRAWMHLAVIILLRDPA
jgi:hypothetical protein